MSNIRYLAQPILKIDDKDAPTELLEDILEIIVEDSGPGVHPDIVEHLFDPFYSGRPAGRGKGLGLSLAWKFAKANQGRVEFRQKQVDQPTRFTLFLPSSDLLNISETPVPVAA